MRIREAKFTRLSRWLKVHDCALVVLFGPLIALFEVTTNWNDGENHQRKDGDRENDHHQANSKDSNYGHGTTLNLGSHRVRNHSS